MRQPRTPKAKAQSPQHGASSTRRGAVKSKKPARKEKSHAPVAPKLKPAPPITDCLKCRKLADEKRETTRLRKALTRRDELDRARVLATMAGQPVVMSDAEVQSAIEAAYTPAFAQILQVPVEIALSPAEEAGDRLKAVDMITNRRAGKVADKVQHSGSITTNVILKIPDEDPAPGGP